MYQGPDARVGVVRNLCDQQVDGVLRLRSSERTTEGIGQLVVCRSEPRAGREILRDSFRLTDGLFVMKRGKASRKIQDSLSPAPDGDVRMGNRRALNHTGWLTLFHNLFGRDKIPCSAWPRDRSCAIEPHKVSNDLVFAEK